MSVIAEVIEASTRSLVAEVYRDAEPPAFGSWIRVPHETGLVLYALVSHVEVSSVEPNRRAVAFGKTREELRREMPHVLELLRTTVRAQVHRRRHLRPRRAVRLPADARPPPRSHGAGR